jgi:hypothetical protein
MQLVEHMHFFVTSTRISVQFPTRLFVKSGSMCIMAIRYC